MHSLSHALPANLLPNAQAPAPAPPAKLPAPSAQYGGRRANLIPRHQRRNLGLTAAQSCAVRCLLMCSQMRKAWHRCQLHCPPRAAHRPQRQLSTLYEHFCAGPLPQSHALPGPAQPNFASTTISATSELPVQRNAQASRRFISSSSALMYGTHCRAALVSCASCSCTRSSLTLTDESTSRLCTCK